MEEKKQRHYTKHLKEQRELADDITTRLVPYYSTQNDTVKRILTSFLETHEMTKDDWKTLYDIVYACADLMDEATKLIAFQKRYLEGATYKSKHTTFYFVEANQYATYCLKHMETSHAYDITTEKGLDGYNYLQNLSAEHLFFFITVKEKLGITD